METKFFIGQPVRSDKFGEGVVIEIENDIKPICVQFKSEKFTRWFYPNGSYVSDRELHMLHPIDPPKTTMTEWQRKQFMNIHWLTNKYQMDDIERILSEPEPPKYEPKQGEAVLFPEDGILKVGVFSNMVGDKYRIEDGSRSAVHKICIPYEANKQGYSADALLSELSKPTHQ